MHMQEVKVAADVDFGEVAAMCEGYSGDDVTNICRDAAMNGMRTLIAGKTPDQIRCRTSAMQNARMPSSAQGNCPVGAWSPGGTCNLAAPTVLKYYEDTFA